MRNKNNNSKGFTLIELLVVIATIGLLAAVVLASLNTARDKANDAFCIAETNQLQKAVELFYNDHGNYLLPNAVGPGNPSGITSAVDIGGTGFVQYVNSLASPNYITLPDKYDTCNPELDVGDPGPMWVNNNGNCLKFQPGYYIHVKMFSANNPQALNDGGLYPFLFETWGGNVNRSCT